VLGFLFLLCFMFWTKPDKKGGGLALVVLGIALAALLAFFLIPLVRLDPLPAITLLVAAGLVESFRLEKWLASVRQAQDFLLGPVITGLLSGVVALLLLMAKIQ
jgi:hypothetical protein